MFLCVVMCPETRAVDKSEVELNEESWGGEVGCQKVDGMGFCLLGQWSIGWSSVQTRHLC